MVAFSVVPLIFQFRTSLQAGQYELFHASPYPSETLHLHAGVAVVHRRYVQVARAYHKQEAELMKNVSAVMAHPVSL